MNKYGLYIEHRDTETQRSCAKKKNSVALCSVYHISSL